MKTQLLEVLSSAKRALDRQDLAASLSLYQQALKIAPASFEANFFLAIVYIDLGNRSEAIRCLQKATQVRPASVEAWFNLGSMLQKEKRYSEAEAALQRVLELNPEVANAYNDLGLVYQETGRLNAAAESFENAVRLQPDMLAAWQNLGVVSIKLKNSPAAVMACEKAKALAPESAEVRFALGLAYELSGQMNLAKAEWDAALAIRPEVEEWRYHRAAALGDRTPSTAPREYVRNLFDAYAAKFDAHLKGQLQYQAPDLLFEVAGVQPDASLNILDLGCGTGLCGKLFRSAARHLVGVDLSAAMIEQAAAAQVYDTLHVEDIVEFLAAKDTANPLTEKFDLVLASDVFIYVGDLTNVFCAVKAILKSGGRFLFTVEAAETVATEEGVLPASSADQLGFVLNSTRRFTHFRWYPERLAREHGFRLELVRKSGLRRQAGELVGGWVFILAGQE